MAEPAQWAVRVTWEGDGPNEANLRQLYDPFGAVNVIFETIVPESNIRSAVVYFRTQQEAQKAQDDTEGIVVENCYLEVVVVPPVLPPPPPIIIKVSKSPGPDNVDKQTLYITQLNPATTNSTLTEAFKPYNVVSCNIPPNQKGTAIHGFANFSNEIDAQNALENLNGKNIDGSKVRIKFNERIIPPPPPKFNNQTLIIRNL
ncbi:MAG: hypothetical protein EZS28_042400, partial [Streblomastix strix]